VLFAVLASQGREGAFQIAEAVAAGSARGRCHAIAGRAARVKKQLSGVMSDIESIAKQAHIVAFNAQVVAARSGASGRERLVEEA
jgi:methyl-accepting chemotaxis protein